jgi:multisubunit Na+/H+ antiporter MnhC subunit
MVYEYIAVTVLVALLKKGSLQQLSNTEIKHSYIIITCFLIQIAAINLDDRSSFVDKTFPIWILSSYLMLAFTSWANRDLPGFKLFAAGMLLNFTAIAANGGRMPVSIEALRQANLSNYLPVILEDPKKHQVLTETTNLPFLTDVIPLSQPLVLMNMVVSVGDLVITAGICWFIYSRMTLRVY